ncbi:MAG: hypothetical protein ABI554_08190 [Flavobacterium sp.]
MNLLDLMPKFIDKKVSCSIFGHKIVTVKNVTSHFKEYKCTVCEMELTNDLQNRKTFLTPELKEINETLFNHYTRKHLSHM